MSTEMALTKDSTTNNPQSATASQVESNNNNDWKEKTESSEHSDHQQQRQYSQSVDRQSLISNTDTTVSVDEKEYRRRKLEKIRRFLGERINSSELNVEPRPDFKNLTPKDRQNYFRRVNKLQSLFGEIPPNDYNFHQQSQTSRIVDLSAQDSDPELTGVDEVVNDVDVFYLLSTEQIVRDLVELMDKFDMQEGFVAGDATVEEQQQQPALADVAKSVHQARQRKRIGKLSRFFGTSTGPISSELSSDEDKMLIDLGRHLEDVIHPAVLKSLVQKLTSSQAINGNSSLNAEQIIAETIASNTAAKLEAQQLMK